MENFVSFENVNKWYMMGTQKIAASDNVNFTVDEGEFCVIVGPSGAGKTTVLNILGGMDRCDNGKISLDGNVISEYTEKQLVSYRRHEVGFVFQFYNLMQNLTALENVEIAAELCTNPLNPKDVLERVGLGERMNNFPSQLSGGEQQRVSIARALAKNPKILLCDEPTGALDYQTGKAVLKLLHDTCVNDKKTVIVITHNSAFGKIADRIISVKNGTVVSQVKNTNKMNVDDLDW